LPHTFYVETGVAKMLVGFQPMQFEGFQREVGQPALERVLPPPAEGHPDMGRLAPIAQRNGFEILGPPGPPARFPVVTTPELASRERAVLHHLLRFEFGRWLREDLDAERALLQWLARLLFLVETVQKLPVG
jgi:hypothetical protein